ncbi:hypothetical protein IV203_007972 [Nitzschia inconspicua]|uniref:Uncharacterized protein n=1 Tax=Nitzschia inconspicua TaxID=303405 RepID=A0A9K3KYS9_9STRA|nr:hypothetical protein IV203_007972 [Nitzschia inconspicua]
MEQTVGRPDATNNVAVKATYFIFHDNAATEEFVEVGGNKHENDHNDSSALSISPGGISLIEEEKEQKIKLTKSTMSSKTHSISSADSGGPSTKKSKTQKDGDGG